MQVLEAVDKVFRVHAAVTKLEMTRRKIVKLGHGGTLDPLARGVLVIGVNDGCKELNKHTNFVEKVYEAVGMFGISTDTDDSEGKIIQRASIKHITKEKIEAILPKFTGAIQQVPPLYSALRMNGRRLYDYARSNEGLPKEIPRREIKIHFLNLLDFTTDHNYFPQKETKNDIDEEDYEKKESEEQCDTPTTNNDLDEKNHQEKESSAFKKEENNFNEKNKKLKSKRIKYTYKENEESTKIDQINEDGEKYPIFKIQLKCSSGTYIRSLIRDMGSELDSAACMVDLLRTEQGEFKLTDALEWEDIFDFDNIYNAINKQNRNQRKINISDY
ncbi:hypothetical protein G9A89_020583 [Geosiphon pyriformis]|nr:hypothetical protein G9A89_020583 [Geosiphon pyriformis]